MFATCFAQSYNTANGGLGVQCENDSGAYVTATYPLSEFAFSYFLFVKMIEDTLLKIVGCTDNIIGNDNGVLYCNI